MDDIKDKLAEAATSLDNGASDVVENLQSRAGDAWDSAQHRTNRAMRDGSAYVHENPVPAALAAFGVGLVAGLFLNRRDSVSFKDRYIAEPLHQSRGVLLGLLLACGTLLRRTFSSASSAAEEMAGDVGDGLRDSLKPLRKAARKTGRKVGL